jgi:pimeloyl-ACP methyl ester carboxylesterase
VYTYLLSRSFLHVAVDATFRKTRKMTEQQALQLLEISDEQLAAVEAMVQSAARESIQFWKLPPCEEIYIPVEDAEIRVLHIRPERPAARRPLVFIPGWGVIPEGFAELYGVIHGQADFYYIETREKGSSRIHSKRADMSVSQSARDIQAALDSLGLSKLDDFVLAGSCWGSATILQGVIDGSLDAPTVVAIDPMHSLWFPKWLLRYVSPILPIPAVNLLKPILRNALLGDMEEEAQKKRVDAFIDAADNWKWKKSADGAIDFELYGKLSRVDKEIFVFNGSVDKIHENANYPQIAHELPKGRLIYMPVHESQRERCMAVACLEFAKVKREKGVPASLARFEIAVR